MGLSILFLGKADDPYCAQGLAFCQQNAGQLTACLGQWGDPLPAAARDWQGDVIVSYLSRWVVPAWLLERARVAAINFHPASPDYPGIGCNNFALYDGAPEYGVTCHHMAPQVDTGGIIKVLRFPIFAADTVDSLLQRTYAYQLVLFYDVMGLLFRGEPLPAAAEQWTRPPYTRKEFNQLMTITPDMDADEIARRIRATSYGKWQPHIDLGGFRFEYRPPER